MAAKENSTTAYFGSVAEGFSQQYKANVGFQDRLQLFVNAVKKTTPLPAKVLDYGCGPGVITTSLAQAGFETTGLDGAAGMIAHARLNEKLVPAGQLTFDVVDAENLQLHPESYDAVVCSSVVEYVPDDFGLIAKLVSAVKPGGTLVISIPQAATMGSIAEDLLYVARRNFKREKGVNSNTSLRRYHRGRFIEKLEQLGIESTEITAFEFPVMGRFGVWLSRFTFVGVMLLVVGRKRKR